MTSKEKLEVVKTSSTESQLVLAMRVKLRAELEQIMARTPWPSFPTTAAAMATKPIPLLVPRKPAADGKADGGAASKEGAEATVLMATSVPATAATTAKRPIPLLVPRKPAAEGKADGGVASKEDEEATVLIATSIPKKGPILVVPRKVPIVLVPTRLARDKKAEDEADERVTSEKEVEDKVEVEAMIEDEGEEEEEKGENEGEKGEKRKKGGGRRGRKKKARKEVEEGC